MSSYKSGFGSGGVDYGATQEKGRVMEQVQSQIAVANLQEMIMVSWIVASWRRTIFFLSENVGQVLQKVYNST